ISRRDCCNSFMATQPSRQASVSTPRRRTISGVRLMLILGLLASLALCLALSWTTRDAMANLSFLNKQGEKGRLTGSQKPLVDLSPWQTAQALAALAVTAEEL